MECFYNLLIQWLLLKQDGKNLSEYVVLNEYYTIAIYGMSDLGRRLLDELRETDIKVKYNVDRNADSIAVCAPKYKPQDKLEKVDVMVVTAIYYFQDIIEDMKKM